MVKFICFVYYNFIINIIKKTCLITLKLNTNFRIFKTKCVIIATYINVTNLIIINYETIYSKIA